MENPIKMYDLGVPLFVYRSFFYHMYGQVEALLLALGLMAVQPTKKDGRKMAEDAEKVGGCRVDP